MGLGIDVGIDAQAHPAPPPARAGDGGERLELADALDVEAEHAGSERLRHLGAGLADAGEDDPRRIAAGRQHPLELAAGDDVEAAARRANHCSTARFEFALTA
jgi:hypothetical protein